MGQGDHVPFTSFALQPVLVRFLPCLCVPCLLGLVFGLLGQCFGFVFLFCLATGLDLTEPFFLFPFLVNVVQFLPFQGTVGVRGFFLPFLLVPQLSSGSFLSVVLRQPTLEFFGMGLFRGSGWFGGGGGGGRWVVGPWGMFFGFYPVVKGQSMLVVLFTNVGGGGIGRGGGRRLFPMGCFQSVVSFEQFGLVTGLLLLQEEALAVGRGFVQRRSRARPHAGSGGGVAVVGRLVSEVHVVVGLELFINGDVVLVCYR